MIGPAAYLDITDLIGTGAELMSLLLLLVSFLLVGYLAYRTKTVRSFQFEMFLVLLIVVAAEFPKMLSSLGLLSISGIEDYGLILHTTSMVFLSGFIGLRASRYFRRRA